MPLYEYRCETCGAEEEAIESFSAPTEHACPQCGAALGMKRQLSKAGFVLAGGGWYASGYGQGGKPEGKAAGDPPAAKPESAPAAPSGPAAGCGGGCSCH